MRLLFLVIILFGFTDCRNPKNVRCKKEFYECARVCASICERTIAHAYEFGKCFTLCNNPCREEYCKVIKDD